MNIAFSSRVPSQCRQELEDLLFFNPHQHKVRSGILDSLKAFGHPRLEEGPEGVTVRVGDKDVQSLFAFDTGRLTPDPVGAVIFLRTSPEEIAVLHVAVHEDYALKGKRAGLGLGVALVEKVKEIASRIVGIQRIVFFYRQQVIIRVK